MLNIYYHQGNYDVEMMQKAILIVKIPDYSEYIDSINNFVIQNTLFAYFNKSVQLNFQ